MAIQYANHLAYNDVIHSCKSPRFPNAERTKAMGSPVRMEKKKMFLEGRFVEIWSMVFEDKFHWVALADPEFTM